MTITYSPSTRGFYTSDIHGENFPPDVVAVSAEAYATLMAGQSQGKEIRPGAGGAPELFDAPDASPVDQIAALEAESMLPRVAREFMLAGIELEASRNVPPITTEQLYAANIGYKKLKDLDDEIAALRDLL